MGCDNVKVGDTVMIVCSRGGSRQQPCRFCGQPRAGFLCDYPVGPGKKTCDAPICSTCLKPGPYARDYCPTCAEKDAQQQQLQLEPKKEAMGGRLINELTWSNSTSTNLAECPRRVWLKKFGAWGGWEREADERTRMLYMMKELKSRHGWLGDLVHRAIKDALDRVRRGEETTLQQTLIRWASVMKQEFVSSRRQDYLKIKKQLGLIEHHYGIPVTDAKWKEISEKFERCVTNFWNGRTFSQLRAALLEPLGEEEWLGYEELEHVMVDGVKCWVQLDHAWRRFDRKIEVVDWKTGREPKQKDIEQVSAYGVFASHKWGVPIDQVVGRLVYLDDGQEIEVEITPASIDVWRSRIAADIAEMKQRRLQIDPAGNCTAPEDAWPETLERKFCKTCEFQGDCKPF